MNPVRKTNRRNLHNFQLFRETKFYMTDSPRNEAIESKYARGWENVCED